jgi:hypothetical protein
MPIGEEESIPLLSVYVKLREKAFQDAIFPEE